MAGGRIECYFGRKLKSWDYAAGMLLIEEAGGKLLDYEGNPLQLQYEANVVAGNGKIEELVVKEYIKR